MAYQQVREILTALAADHDRLARVYQLAAERHRDEPSQLLASDLAARGARTSQTIRAYLRDAPPEVLLTWIQYPLTGEIRQRLRDLEISPGLPPDTLLRRAIDADEAFLYLYRQLASATSAARVQELFDSLAAITQEAERHAARAWVELEEERT